MRLLAAFAGSLICVGCLVAGDIPAPTGDTIVPANAKLELLFTRTAKIKGGLTEGPACAQDGAIYFSDIPAGPDQGMVLRFDPQTKQTTVFLANSRMSNGLKFDRRGRLWVIQYLQYPTPAGLKPVDVDRYLRTKYDRVPDPPPKGPRGADRITILEDTDGDGLGLDNDGNGLRDFPADPACAAQGTTTTTLLTPAVSCGPAPLAPCVAPAKLVLMVNEKSAGKEKVKISLTKLIPAVSKTQFGDPVTGTTSYAVCIYDASDQLVGRPSAAKCRRAASAAHGPTKTPRGNGRCPYERGLRGRA